MGVKLEEMDQERHTKWKRPVFLATGATLVLLVVGAAGVALWNLNSRIDDLQVRLSGVQQRASAAEQDAARKTDALRSLERELPYRRST